ALTRGPVGLQPHLLHCKKNAAMDGLHAVADVGKSAADDHRHGVVEVRPLHLLFNVDGLNVQGTGAIAAGRRSQREFRVLFVSHSLALSCRLQPPARNDKPAAGKTCNWLCLQDLMCLGSWIYCTTKIRRL